MREPAAGERPANQSSRSNSAVEAAPGPRNALPRGGAHPAVVVDEAHQADGEARRRGGSAKPSERRHSMVGRRSSTGSTAVGDDVEEEEDQDAGRDGGEERLRRARVDALHAADRKADEDRERRRSRRAAGSAPVPMCKAHLTQGTRHTIRAWRRGIRSTSTWRRSTSSRSRSASTGRMATRLADAGVAGRGDARRLARFGRGDAEAARGAKG